MPKELRQREPREECPAYLAFLRRKPCCACGAPPRSQAAHIRIGNPEIRKRSVGIGEKPHDRWAVPLCSSCHLDSPSAQHKIGERAFWHQVGVDPFKLAMKLYAQFERQQTQTPKQSKKKGGAAPKVSRRFVTKTKVSHSRPMRSANRWPPRGSRKLRNSR